MEGEKRKILITDDDGFLLDMYSFKFNQNNFDVFTATNGKEAVDKLRAGFAPDIILLDVIMPEMNGFEALEAIKKENLSPKSIKIMLTNKNTDEDSERAMSLGALGYIIKANNVPSEVIKKVLDIVEKKEKENIA